MILKFACGRAVSEKLTAPILTRHLCSYVLSPAVTAFIIAICGSPGRNFAGLPDSGRSIYLLMPAPILSAADRGEAFRTFRGPPVMENQCRRSAGIHSTGLKNVPVL
jgi:hypothetical protein